MKKTLVMAALTMVSAAAFAEVKLTVRSDYTNTMKYKSVADKDVSGTSAFVPNHARLAMTGKVGNSDVMAALNLRSFGTVLQNDGATNQGTVTRVLTPETFVEYMYLSHKVDDAWTFTAGKIENMLGGFENDQDSAGDNYLQTLTYGGVGGTKSVASSLPTIVTTPGNGSGFGMMYGMGDHSFTFQAMNDANAGSASVGAANASVGATKRHSMNLIWNGSFGDIKARIGYGMGVSDTSTVSLTTGETTGNTSTDQKFTHIGVMGTAAEKLAWTVEHMMNESKSQADNAKKDATTSTYAQVKYNMGFYNPLFRYEMGVNKAQEDDNGAGSFKRTAMVLGLEMKPSDSDFRYHAVLASANDKYGQASLANDKTNWQQLIVGIKYTGDIVK